MIQMIRGVTSISVDGILKRMDKNSAPFDASPEQEERLIRLGMAVRVYDGAPIGFDEIPPEGSDIGDLPDGVVGIPEYSTKNTKAELMEIGELCGLTLDERMSKAEMVAALDAHIEENMADGVDIDGDATEDDGEPAPTFDASEAVL